VQSCLPHFVNTVDDVPRGEQSAEMLSLFLVQPIRSQEPQTVLCFCDFLPTGSVVHGVTEMWKTALQKCGRQLCRSHYERLVNTNDLYILAWHCHSKWMVQWLILMIDCLVDLKVEWQKQKRRVAEMYFSPVYIADNKWKHNVIWNEVNVVHQTFLTII